MRIAKFGTLILIIALAGGTAVAASDNVTLMVGRSTVLDTGSPIARVSLTSSDIADALVTSSSELLINGKTPGTISMFVWDRAGAIHRYEVVVTRDLARLSDQMKELFPGETIAVQSTGKHIVLSGNVSQKDVVDKAVSVAAGYVDKRDEVVSLLQIREAAASNQVLLRVRFAEVNRTALTQLGASWYSDGAQNTVGSVTTQQFATPFFDQNHAAVGERQVFSDYLNLFLFDFKHNIGAVIKALQSRGLLQSLAEPNLVAESGKEASFLAGGEYPVPIAQPNGSAVMVTVVYKEFGIRLNFTPTVTGDRVHLKVRPEVSSLDFANAVTLNGFRIPALSTRRTETELELQNGQTFAIAGLINNQVSKTMQRVPGIGDIPILGLLFRSEAAQKDRTELVVMITPEILPRNSNGVTPNLPRVTEPFLPALEQKKSLEAPAPAFSTSTAGAAAAAVAMQTAQPPAEPAKPERPDPADAAAKLNALLPSTTLKPLILPAPATSTPQVVEAEATPSRPLTQKERDAIAQARKQAAAAEADRNAKQKKEQDRQTREQAKRDAEAAKQAEEAAKREAEIEKKQQKAVAEAEAKLKAAQAAYDAAKTKKP
ncbi:MAG TPA: pilus assembly protein N-terminal domain-containing protein [Vicinamibacterales bacterium]|nr:pilus assembly protein N-terminal domain-containing protein [Vicinamibacterales bacterium]